jgi:serine/threonine protein kinase
MNKPQPNPGDRYIVKERLGQGRWKEVYRAVVRGEWRDRALARFIEEPSGTALYDEIKLLLESRNQLPNVAALYNVFKGADGKLYLEEELLYRPIEALAPLQMVDRFYRIARDLFKGLNSLHQLNRVHRDLKLDNCGIDHSGAAKIFDLGSVTSEGKSVKGTTLSRAPELFAADATMTKASDVWALGAVLFALRTGGNYPFVTKEEARTRPPDGLERQGFDQMVQERATHPKAVEELRERIKRDFPNGSGSLMYEILSFDPAKRPTAGLCAERWDTLLRSWTAMRPMGEATSAERDFEDTVAYLNAVLRGSAAMSSLQWARATSAIESLEPRLDDAKKKLALQDLRRRVKEMLESVPA